MRGLIGSRSRPLDHVVPGRGAQEVRHAGAIELNYWIVEPCCGVWPEVWSVRLRSRIGQPGCRSDSAPQGLDQQPVWDGELPGRPGFRHHLDKNPQYKDPKRYGGDTPLAWALHIQNDFSPATWSFRGQPREVVRSIRVPYHVIDDNRVVVEHVLIGWEALTDDERPNPEIDGSGNPDHRWKHFFSSGDFDPKVTAWSSDMELLGWLLMYSGNPLYDQSVTGEYKITGTVSGAKPNVAQINNWNDKIVQEKKKSAIWPFRSRPTRIDGSIRIPYRAYAKGPKEWYRVWLLVGYEGGGAM